MSILDALRSALGRLPPAEDPWEVADLRGKVDDLLDDLVDRSDADEKQQVRGGIWIFRARPDRRVYAQAILDLLEVEIANARAEVASSFLAEKDWSCACRCRAHGQPACPICLGVDGCPVHSEADPATLEKNLLDDPAETARAIRVELAEIAGDSFESWEDLDESERRAWIEACRRVVSTRVV